MVKSFKTVTSSALTEVQIMYKLAKQAIPNQQVFYYYDLLPNVIFIMLLLLISLIININYFIEKTSYKHR